VGLEEEVKIGWCFGFFECVLSTVYQWLNSFLASIVAEPKGVGEISAL